MAAHANFCRPPRAAAYLVALAVMAAPALGAEFTIDIAGTPAMAIRGECTVVVNGESEHAEFRALVPKQYIVVGSAASCTVQKMDSFGRLKVALITGGRTVAKAETAATFNWVRIRSDGPWGAARGIRGHQRAIEFPTPAPRPIPPRRLPRRAAPR